MKVAIVRVNGKPYFGFGRNKWKVIILINRKKIKNVHLKVYRDLSVRLNLPDIVLMNDKSFRKEKGLDRQTAD